MDVILGDLSAAWAALAAAAPAEPAAPAQGGGGFGAILGNLGLNWAGFIWHAINFLVLLGLLYAVLFKPVTRMLEERERRIRESLERAEEVRRQAEEAEATRQALLAEARRDAEQIRSRAADTEKRIVGEAQARAQEEATRILNQARTEIEASRQQMMAEVRAELADLVVTATDRVTRQALDAQGQRVLIQQFLAESADGQATARRG